MVGFSPLSMNPYAAVGSAIAKRFRPATRPATMATGATGGYSASGGYSSIPNPTNAALGAVGAQQQNNPYQQAMAGYGAPAIANADLQLAQLRERLGLANANTQVQTGYLNQQQGFANQRNTLDQQALAGERNDLAGRGQFLDTGYGLDKEAYELMAGSTGRRLGNLPQLQGLANQGFDIQEGDIKRQNASQLRGVKSSATSRGAMASQGYRDDVSDLTGDLNSALGGLGIDRSRSALDFKEQGAGINDEYNRGRIGFRNSENQFNYNKEQLASANRQLDIESQKLGISADETKARINNAIQQLGISGVADANAIMLEMSKIDQGLISSLPPQILQTIRAITGLSG